MKFKNNTLFTCDALNVLERLPSELVTLAYLDPPWNSGFDLGREFGETIKLPNEEYARYLSKIAQQIHRILSDKGSLFVHWSPIPPLDIRLIVNQVFGEQPKYEITWLKKVITNRSSKPDNDFILVYSKSDEPIYNPIFRPPSSEFFNFKDAGRQYRAEDLTTPFVRPERQFIWRGYQLPPQKSWKFTFDKLETLAKENKIHFPSTGTGIPRLKRYLDEHPGIELDMIWDDISNIIPANESMVKTLQMPLALMERIIQIGSNTEDLILDPFCGTGTTLIAAQSLNRSWWGIDNSVEMSQITREGLLKTYGLEAEKDYAVVKENDTMEYPIIDTSYKDVVLKVDEIAKLQRSVDKLTDSLLNMKRLMNIGEDASEQRVEDTIKQMEDWITVSISNQSAPIENYIGVVCKWLTNGWERLDIASQSFLPQAELLFENIEQTNSKDYSPFIIQYCRALENELLIKLFVAYTDDFHNRILNINDFLDSDFGNEKTSNFAKFLKNHQDKYTLGDMIKYMGAIRAGGKTLSASPLLKDFRDFALKYFEEKILDKQYLEQIETIRKDFRNQAAHPYILDAESARSCRDQVRKCLNELILNYKG